MHTHTHIHNGATVTHFSRTSERITRLNSSKSQQRDFPGGPVAKTPHSQYRDPGFNPWPGN